jgi:hypothetical protein
MKCSKCGVDKEMFDFYKSKITPTGFRSWCKSCFINNINQRRKPRERTEPKNIGITTHMSCCNIIKKHHDALRDDPERLSSEFIKELSGCRCRNDNQIPKKRGNLLTPGSFSEEMAGTVHTPEPSGVGPCTR